MADIHKLSKQVADMAERLADIADAARGRRSRRIGAVRWLLLPAAGAAAYAVAKRAPGSKTVAREVDQRAPEGPDVDLFGRVKEFVGVPEDDHDQLERNRQERAKRRQRRQRASA